MLSKLRALDNVPISMITSELCLADRNMTVGEFIDQLVQKASQLPSPDPELTGHTIAMEGDNRFKSIDYKPMCKCGYDDCIYDPAYIYNTYPDWYKQLYGDKTPEEAVLDSGSSCSCCEEGDRYDDEDK